MVRRRLPHSAPLNLLMRRELRLLQSPPHVFSVSPTLRLFIKALNNADGSGFCCPASRAPSVTPDSCSA
ncbi:hypothetical protein OJAV_G00203810 [Oryzias javanicus]|uniref:Uncharacterized protein n=1 Tax=Oryzias javanicus TaxID=123683 RepID=A0A437C5M6_ORYJA|nr:hypothetical protein OJAV_G00203810 [Oryzias javanicus]